MPHVNGKDWDWCLEFAIQPAHRHQARYLVNLENFNQCRSSCLDRRCRRPRPSRKQWWSSPLASRRATRNHCNDSILSQKDWISEYTSNGGLRSIQHARNTSPYFRSQASWCRPLIGSTSRLLGQSHDSRGPGIILWRCMIYKIFFCQVVPSTFLALSWHVVMLASLTVSNLPLHQASSPLLLESQIFFSQQRYLGHMEELLRQLTSSHGITLRYWMIIAISNFQQPRNSKWWSVMRGMHSWVSGL